MDFIGGNMSHIVTKWGTANLTKDGYYMITSVKEGNCKKFVHRLVFEDYYKVTLCPWTIIHHKDGNKINNSIDNLEALSRNEHPKRHESARFKEEARVIKNGFARGIRVWALRWQATRMKRSFNREMLEMMADEMNTY